MEEADSVFDFPCRFPIKAMGRDAEGFPAHVLELIGAVTGPVPPQDMTVRASRRGRFISVTVTITAQSRAQLDAVYRNLTDSARVLYAL